MPRGRSNSNYPLTPAASTDITAKSSAHDVHIESGFELPPAAIESSRGVSSPSSMSSGSDSSYRPLSPTSPSISRKRTLSATQQQDVTTVDDEYSLPPPPMRPRKIIQMNPKKAQQPVKAKDDAPKEIKVAAAGGGNKKKSGGAATAQSRKVARKTAHSLIERRRRSKMNEEFGILKDLIPNCKGQDMHKLSILQAGIEYTRYLQQCVSDLQTAHRSRPQAPERTPSTQLPPPPAVETASPGNSENGDDEETQERDQDMRDIPYPPSTNVSPAICPLDRRYTSSTIHSSDSTTTSPNIFPTNTYQHPAYASFSTTSPQIHPSPAFSAQGYPTQYRGSFSSVASRKESVGDGYAMLTSPALGPSAPPSAVPAQTDRDHEATAALLMLNTDRRSWGEQGQGQVQRRISVRDLLAA